MNIKQNDYNEQMRGKLEEYGWICEVILKDENYPYGFNCHTHGVKENFDHPDLLIVLPMKPEVCGAILTRIVDDIKNGKVFAAKYIYRSYLKNNMPLTLDEDTESGRSVLKVILPDEKQNLFLPEIEPPFDKQWVK